MANLSFEREDRLWRAQHLQRLAHACGTQAAVWNEIAQARRVNKKRGGWRRPGLAGSVSRLEKLLRGEFERTERAMVAALRMPTATQASQDELERAALEHYDLDPQEASQPVESSKLAALLLLLGLWRSRHLAAAEAAIEETFGASRAQVLKRLKRPDATERPETAALAAQVTRRFKDDAERLYKDLLDGSPRSPGVRDIVEGEPTLGAAALAIRSLFDAESYRLTMFSEALVWAAWMAGFRAGAVDSTNALIADGVALEKLPRFSWRGPLDERTCDPCRRRFGEPIVARSLADLPDPTTICEFRYACRHFWSVI